MNFNFNNFLVYGTGKTGLSVAKFLKSRGFSVFLADDSVDNLEKFSQDWQIVKNVENFKFSTSQYSVLNTQYSILNTQYIVHNTYT